MLIFISNTYNRFYLFLQFLDLLSNRFYCKSEISVISTVIKIYYSFKISKSPHQLEVTFSSDVFTYLVVGGSEYPGGGTSSNLVGIIWPPSWDRVYWLAICQNLTAPVFKKTLMFFQWSPDWMTCSWKIDFKAAFFNMVFRINPKSFETIFIWYETPLFRKYLIIWIKCIAKVYSLQKGGVENVYGLCH